MRISGCLLLFVLFGLHTGFAEQDSSSHLESTYVFRTGEQLQGPHVLTYRLLEYAQTRGRWTFPDMGYYDTGNLSTQLWFIGTGADVVRTRHFAWNQTIYVAQESGSAASNQRTIRLWPVLDFTLTRHLTGQAVVFPILPIDHSAKAGFGVDRAKLEVAASSHLRFGAGYNASKCTGSPIENDPFGTITVTNRAGAWEFWLQHMAGGGQVQLRYVLVRKGY
jgi:hypothetical protein